MNCAVIPIRLGNYQTKISRISKTSVQSQSTLLECPTQFNLRCIPGRSTWEEPRRINLAQLGPQSQKFWRRSCSGRSISLSKPGWTSFLILINHSVNKSNDKFIIASRILVDFHSISNTFRAYSQSRGERQSCGQQRHQAELAIAANANFSSTLANILYELLLRPTGEGLHAFLCFVPVLGDRASILPSSGHLLIRRVQRKKKVMKSVWRFLDATVASKWPASWNCVRN